MSLVQQSIILTKHMYFTLLFFKCAYIIMYIHCIQYISFPSLIVCMYILLLFFYFLYLFYFESHKLMLSMFCKEDEYFTNLQSKYAGKECDKEKCVKLIPFFLTVVHTLSCFLLKT